MSFAPALRRYVRPSVVLAAVVALLCCLIGPSPMATAATRTPSVPSGLPAGIERLAAYVPANSCGSATRPGTDKLGRMLTSTYPGTSYGGLRGCGTLPTSEHFDGRAVDWMNSIRNTTQAAQAKAVITWLHAADNQDQQYANARRLGVMYIIWNNKIWSIYSADEGWRSYQNCSKRPQKSLDSVCHRNHVHLSLSWEGAMGRTSYWSKSVARRDYGPCRPADLNWAAPYRKANPVRCTRYARASAPRGASATRRALTTYSGMELRTGSTGNAVKSVQKVVRVTADGRFGPKTRAAVQQWQRAHRVPANGVVDATTWRALLRAVR